MKNRLFFIIIGLIWFGTLMAQINDSVLISHYGSIRADMTRDACKIAGFDSVAILNMINNVSLADFKKNIKDNNLKKIIDAAKPLSGIDIERYDRNIWETRNSYVRLLKKQYPEKTTEIDSLFSRYINKISMLTAEFKVLSEDAQNKYANYLQLYPNGQLRHLIEPEEVGKSHNSGTAANDSNNDASSFMNSETSNNKGKERSGGLLPIIVLLALIFICLFYYRKFYRGRKGKKLPKVKEKGTPIVITKESTTPVKKIDNLEEKTAQEEEKEFVHKEIKDHGEISTLSSNDSPASPKKPIQLAPQGHAMAIDADDWIVVGASVQGNGHLKNDIPCQDNHAYEYLQNGWGIAITSDGAGSAKYSQIGSAFVVNRAMVHFKELITREEWIKKSLLPTDLDWEKKAFKVLKSIRDELELLSKKRECNIKDLSATIIVVIHSPFGLLTTHIGDGRAGYRNNSGEWYPVMTPHKGEESNQTIFIPSDFWNISFFEMKGITVPESRVIREQISAFTLMSDGCEKTSWLCNQYNDETGKYYDPNIPYDRFFNPLIETLLLFRSDNDPLSEREDKWYRFIKSGNESFEIETDDKTMILAAIYK